MGLKSLFYVQTVGVLKNQLRYFKSNKGSIVLLLFTSILFATYPLLLGADYSVVSGRQEISKYGGSQIYYLKTNDTILQGRGKELGLQSSLDIGSSCHLSIVRRADKPDSVEKSCFDGFTMDEYEIRVVGDQIFYDLILVSSLLSPNHTSARSMKTIKIDLPKVYSFTENMIANFYGIYLPIFLISAVATIMGVFLAFLTEDHEKKLKNGFLLAGLSKEAYWIGNLSAYILISIIFMAIASVGFYVTFKLPSERGAFFVFSNIVYGLNTILFGALSFQVMPERKVLRNAIGGFWLSGFPILVSIMFLAFKRVFTYNTWLITVLCLFFPSLSNVFIILQIATSKESLLSRGLYAHIVPSPFELVFILIGQSLIFLVLLLLLRTTPSDSGIDFSRLIKSLRRYSRVISQGDVEVIASDTTWPEETYSNEDQTKILEIKSVSKSFESSGGGARVKALDKVSFTVHSGEIFAVIGHNGSGKTTLLSIVVGMLKPSLGSVILDRVIVTDDNVKNIPAYGFCPQTDILYGTLTVKDHLLFMASIRGIPAKMVDASIAEIVRDLKLESIMTTQCKVLSGGEKRRVCVALAFLGSPNLVILDEPTSGMDPESRHNLWKYLEEKKRSSQKSRKGAIILCTHYMDEADLLADRKAFITAGKVRCVGSSAFFKKTFDCGYSVTIMFTKKNEEGQIFDPILELVKKYDLNCTLGKVSKIDNTIEITISGSLIPEFVTELEEKADSLDIEDFHLRENGLEKIFSVSEVFDIQQAQHPPTSNMKFSKEKGSDFSRVKAAMERIEREKSRDGIFVLAFKFLIFQLKSVFADYSKYVVRLFLAGLVYLVLYLFVKEFKIPESDGFSFDFSNTKYFRDLYGSKKFLLNVCQGMNLSEHLPYEYVSTTGKVLENEDFIDNPNFVGTIDCQGNDNSWKVKYNPTAYLAKEYAAFIIAKATSERDFNLSMTPSSSQSVSFIFSIFKKFLVIFMFGSILDSTLTNILEIMIKDRMSLKFLAYTYGIGPMVFHICSGLRNLIVAAPFFSLLYAIANTLLDLKQSEFSLFFLLMMVACLMQVTLFSYAMEDPAKAQIYFNIFSRILFIGGFVVLLISNEATALTLRRIIAIFTPNNQVFQLLLDYLLTGTTVFSIGDKSVYSISLEMFFAIIGMGITCIFIFEYRHLFYHYIIRSFTFSQPHIQGKDGVTFTNVSKRVLTSLDMKINSNEIFCLLGVNGAGKTTAIKILISQLFPVSGSVSVFSLDPHKDRYKTLRILGYCPQFDALLIPTMTVEDHLRFFASLSTSSIEAQTEGIQALGSAFKLIEYMGTKVSALSGGTKRKVCCAIAFLTQSSQLIVLDEPTTGVDAAARETMWQAFSGCKSFKSIIVTTHYLREAGMSDKIGILSRGKLFSQGSEFQLMQQYGKGYKLIVRVLDAQVFESWRKNQEIIASLERDNATNSSDILLAYVIPDKSRDGRKVLLGPIMKLLSSCLSQGLILSYSLNKTSLEDVFLSLVATAGPVKKNKN